MIKEPKPSIIANDWLWVGGGYLILGGMIWRMIATHFFNWGMAEDFLLVDWYHSIFQTGKIGFSDILLQVDGSHPIGFMVIVVVLLFRIFGVDFTIVVYFSCILLMAAQFFILDSVRKSFSHKATVVCLLLTCFFIEFHPAQTNHILWPFEMCWFLISFALALNIWLLERFGRRALPYTVLVALGASFCSAHGIFTWAAVAVHIGLMRNWPARRGWVAFFTASCLIGVVLIGRIVPTGEASFTLSSVPGFPIYVLNLLGAMFGIRDPLMTGLLGAVMLSMVVFFSVAGYRRRAYFLAADRVGAVLIVASLLMLLSFALGRYRYGLAWALSAFHSSPLIVPMLLGINLLAISTVDRIPSDRWMARAGAAVPTLFIVASIVWAMGYARQMSKEVVLRRSMAMEVSCRQDDASVYLRAGLNGLGENVIYLLDQALPVLRHLCDQPVPDYVQKIEAFPPLFSSMIEDDPSAQEPLQDLWDVYRTHFDLIRAFSVSDEASAKRLLSFARGNAKTGTLYSPEKLARHTAYFQALKEKP